MLRRIYRIIRSTLLHSVIPESKAKFFANGKTGVEVVGLFYNASGLGESARLCAWQLQKEGYKVRCTSVEKFLLKNKEIDWSFQDTASADEIGARIIHLNPPMIPPYAIGTGLRKFASIFNIGYWAWELENLPLEWSKSIRYVNAIAGPSNFTAKTMRRYTDKPVMIIPHPVKTAEAIPKVRGHLGLKSDDFIVSCIFSLQSAPERKNPEGLIKAFLQAFQNTPNAYLVFKISKLGKHKDKLSQFSKNHPNILFIDDIWSREDILGLIKTSNVYASLHRAEGFGLAIAEAMMLGTPVMATDWSGNVDFCNPRNSYPVSYKMIQVRSAHSEFARAGESVWAEADIDQAASILQSIYSDPSESKQKAALCLSETNRYFKGPYYNKAFAQLTEKSA